MKSPRLTSLKDVIAIDGPVGVGKSATARATAKKLGFLFMNTGDMYRALTWKALKEGVDIADSRAVSDFLKHKMAWKFKAHEGILRVYIDGVDLFRQLRSERISRATPTVAQYPAVRKTLRKLQRDIAKKGKVVLEGRDTTTHVASDAVLKVYLDAPAKERALRRYRQLIAEGKRVKLASILDALVTRDRREKKRKIMPGFKSRGTVIVDTANCSLHEVVDKILDLYTRLRSPGGLL